MNSRLITSFAALALTAGLLASAVSLQAAAKTKVTFTCSNGEIIPYVAEGLGYFAAEGLDVQFLTTNEVMKLNPSGDDYDLQFAMNEGKLDFAMNWFQHTLFGYGNNAPVKAVVLLTDAPHMKVMVANRVAGEIKSAADFKGRRIARGAGFSTKAYLTNYLMNQAGVFGDHIPVGLDTEGRLETVLKALKEGTVDVITFKEPQLYDIMKTGEVTVLYDLTSREGCTKALGTYWPARCVFVAPNYIKAHPDTVQHMVNAFVKTMNYLKSHTPEQIAAVLPEKFFTTYPKEKREQQVLNITRNQPQYAKEYTLSAPAVEMIMNAVFAWDFDNSAEGQFRANAKKHAVSQDQYYANEFVNTAMKKIH